MRSLLSKSLQLVLLVVFVLACLATDGNVMPYDGPISLRVTTLPPSTPEGGAFVLPRNATFYMRGDFAVTASPAANDAGVVAGDTDGIALSTSPAAVPRWRAVDLSALDVDVTYDVVLSDDGAVDESNARTVQLRRTNVDDVVAPNIGPLLVDSEYVQQPAPGEQEPAVAVDPADGVQQRCTWEVTLSVESVITDDGGLAFMEVIADGEVREIWPAGRTTHIGWFVYRGDRIPTDEVCYQVAVTDLAGNEARSDEVCVVAVGAENCLPD